MDSPQRPKKLPPHPSLGHLQKQAKRRVKATPSLTLAAAQHQISHEYGFKVWAELVREVERLARTPAKTQSSSPPAAAPEFLTDADLIEARLNKLVAYRARPCGAVAVLVDPKGARFYSAGVSSTKDPIPVDPDTVFEANGLIGILSALVLAESERLGKLSRLDPAARFLFPAEDLAQSPLAGISLLSLAAHTSGLPMWPANLVWKIAEERRSKATKSNLLIEAFRNAENGLRKSGKISFSYFGANLLREALAAAWGRPFRDVLRDQILAPLGMTKTQLTSSNPQLPIWRLKTTARDVEKLLSASLGYTAESLQPSFRALLEPQCPYPGEVAYGGLGWSLTDRTADALAWNHLGLVGMHQAALAIRPATRSGLAILTDSTVRIEPLIFAWLGEKLPQFEKAQLKFATTYLARRIAPGLSEVTQSTGLDPVNDYTGRYEVTRNHVIKVVNDPGVGLRLEIEGGRKYSLVAAGEDRFVSKPDEVRVRFERDESGAIAGLAVQSGIGAGTIW